MNDTTRRAGIEVEYRDGSMRIIARDSFVSARISRTFDKLASARLKDNIRAAWLYYCDRHQGVILAHITAR